MVASISEYLSGRCCRLPCKLRAIAQKKLPTVVLRPRRNHVPCPHSAMPNWLNTNWGTPNCDNHSSFSVIEIKFSKWLTA